MVPLGWMNKRSERDRNVMVHEVHYDPKNMVTCIQIYQTPFDTGSILTKFNLIITGNGLTANPARFILMQLLLKGEAL